MPAEHWDKDDARRTMRTLLFFGVIAFPAGYFFADVAAASGSTAFAVAGSLVAFLGGCLLFVALVAYGVSLGIRVTRSPD